MGVRVGRLGGPTDGVACEPSGHLGVTVRVDGERGVPTGLVLDRGVEPDQ